MTELTTSEEAIEAGKVLTFEDAVYLIGQRNQYLDLVKMARLSDDFDTASLYAFKAQLCREALEASGWSGMLL